MDKEKFNEIIDFAIKGEQEAVEFYQQLQAMVSFAAKKDMLHDLEEMEKGHIKALENLRQNEINDITIPKVQNLRISDYLVEVKPTADMSYQDIIITAMKREESSCNLYSSLADNSDDMKVKNLFLRLAAEEAKHKLNFEKIYDEEILKDN